MCTCVCVKFMLEYVGSLFHSSNLHVCVFAKLVGCVLVHAASTTVCVCLTYVCMCEVLGSCLLGPFFHLIHLRVCICLSVCMHACMYVCIHAYTCMDGCIYHLLSKCSIYVCIASFTQCVYVCMSFLSFLFFITGPRLKEFRVFQWPQGVPAPVN